MEDIVIEYDKYKTKILKYLLYKKRTEKEVIQKFSDVVPYDMLEEIIGELKENGYIDDKNYIKRAVNEFISLKNMSLKELEYKLYSKGLEKDLIENYFSENRDELEDFEIKSAQNIIIKKQGTMEADQIIEFLRKKGYKIDNIKQALSEVE